MSASERWSFGPLVRLHGRVVRGPRIERLIVALSDLAGPSESLLDVGAGDGKLGRGIAARTGVTHYVAVDLAPPAAGPSDAGDGAALPYPDQSFEVVLLADMLHHAEDPARVLREALRCARRAVIVKDHVARGRLDVARLYGMDFVGNRSLAVAIPGRYFSPRGFGELVRAEGGRVERVTWPLDVHHPALRFLAPSEVQFAAVVTPGRATR